MSPITHRHERTSEWKIVDTALDLNQAASSKELGGFRPDNISPTALFRTLLQFGSERDSHEANILLDCATRRSAFRQSDVYLSDFGKSENVESLTELAFVAVYVNARCNSYERSMATCAFHSASRSGKLPQHFVKTTALLEL